jgi:hypothetical protein
MDRVLEDSIRLKAIAAATALAGLTLGEGIAHGWLPLIVAGAAMSAVFPWGIVAAWLVRRIRRGPGRT